MFLRFRVWLASLLVRGTGFTVTRLSHAIAIRDVASSLYRYVETSGGLQDPYRIKAYRVILRSAVMIFTAVDRLVVGTLPTSLPEETHGPEAAEETAA